jgi:DNA polymerase elongation subunit (family B)
MNKGKIKDFLNYKTGYRKEGSKRLYKILTAKGYKVSLKDCKNALKEVRIETKINALNNYIPKILIYDIETSRMEANVWWTGKSYLGSNQLRNETRIITVAYKWLGEDKVEYLKWSKKQSDKKLMKKFLEVYNKADMVIGFNNDNFDNRLINARALKYDLNVNTFVKSFDIMKQAKRLFRLPGYSMNYIAKFIGVQTKLQHSGINMWDEIQYGSKKQAKKAMKMMVKYNIQDITVTEEVFLRMNKYMKSPMHVGVAMGNGKISCPLTGSTNVKLHKTTWTPAGTIQRIFKNKDTNHLFKVSNSKYLKNLKK